MTHLPVIDPLPYPSNCGTWVKYFLLINRIVTKTQLLFLSVGCCFSLKLRILRGNIINLFNESCIETLGTFDIAIFVNDSAREIKPAFSTEISLVRCPFIALFTQIGRRLLSAICKFKDIFAVFTHHDIGKLRAISRIQETPDGISRYHYQ